MYVQKRKEEISVVRLIKKKTIAKILSVTLAFGCWHVEPVFANTVDGTFGNDVELLGDDTIQDTISPTVSPQEDDPSSESEVTSPGTIDYGETKSANIRLMFTTDLHGQLDTLQYETGKMVGTGSLARVKTLIDNARQEVYDTNSYLFDVGDSLYDYTTDYIYNQDDTKLQPIYAAMANVGYDAITLGNHDFDYTLPYIKQQLLQSGLADKCVLSNVRYVNTGNHVWNENKIIEKTAVATDGSLVNIKVGVIGERVPGLSAKRSNYTGTLVIDDIIKNTTEEAAKLKSQGADIVVVLAHSGIGTEQVNYMTHNVSYNITKIPDVDVVLAGHQHQYFPYYVSSKNEAYFSYEGYDKDTKLMNGKNLVMLAEKGQALGIVDLTVEKNLVNSNITDRTSKIVKATSSITPDESINTQYMNEWRDKLESISGNVLGEVYNGESLENYFGMIEDCGAIQLLNSAKIAYALNYINNKKTSLKDYPVVAASNFLNYGVSSPEDYVDIQGDFLQSYMFKMYKYRGIFGVYKVTGKQLREWIEWSASAYETAGNNVLKKSGGNVTKKDITSLSDEDDLEDECIKNYNGSKPLQNVISEEWKNNISKFSVFDGVEYQIDNSVLPRYSPEGTQINDTHRVTSMTINNIKVEDDDIIILACDKLGQDNALISEIASSKIVGGTELGIEKLQHYIEDIGMSSSIRSEVDDNWQVKYSNKYAYLVETSEKADELAEKKGWYKGTLENGSGISYYHAEFSEENLAKDDKGPLLVASVINNEITNKSVDVALKISDRSGISYVKYTKGCYRSDAVSWNYVQPTIENKITCYDNGVYSILAEDCCGNRTVRYVRINNINQGVLQAPLVNTYTNKSRYISGNAEENATIYFELKSGKVYKATVKSDGTFKYKLPVQKAGTVVYVYVVDKQGISSARTVVSVERKGPNRCSVDTVYSNSRLVSGKLNDSYVSLIAIADNVVYVNKNGGKELFETSELYNASYEIRKVNMDIDDGGYFEFYLSRLVEGDSKISFYSLDNLGRNSLSVTQTVVACLPNKPVIQNEVLTNRDTQVTVLEAEKCKITVKSDNGCFSTRSCVWSEEDKKYIYKVSIPRRNITSTVEVYAVNAKGKSASVKMKRYLAKVDLYDISAGAKKVKGEISWNASTTTVIYIKVNNTVYKTKVRKDRTFGIKLKKKLKRNAKVAVWASDSGGRGLITRETAY